MFTPEMQIPSLCQAVRGQENDCVCLSFPFNNFYCK